MLSAVCPVLLRVVVDARRGAGTQHAADAGVLVGGEAQAEGERVFISSSAVSPHDRRRVVSLVAKDSGRIHLEHAGALLRDGGEDTLGARLRCDEGGDSTKRTLFLREAADLVELRLEIEFEGDLVRDAFRRCAQIDSGRHQDRGCAVLSGHQLVRPGNELPRSVFRQPVPDLRAREAGLPDVREHLAERLGFLGRDDELAGVAPDRLVAGEAGQPLAGLVEEQDPSVLAQDADERHRRLGEDSGEVVPEDEVRTLRHRTASLRSPRARAACRRRSPPSARPASSRRRHSPAGIPRRPRG